MLMTKAALRGRELRQELALEGQVDIEVVTVALGLSVVKWCLPGMDEFISDGVVAVADHLSAPEYRWAMGHAIGHHVLHPGNQVWLMKRTRLAQSYEREAEDFSWGFLVDPGEARLDVGTDVLDLAEWDLAEYFGVPQERVRVQARLF